jgi:hypothetical protein
MQENANSRRLAKPDPSMIEDIQGKATWPVKDEMEEPADISSTNLRGSNTQRHLEDLLVFQLRMYWEEGVCVSALLLAVRVCSVRSNSFSGIDFVPKVARRVA